MQTRAEARPHKQFEDNMSVKTASVLISVGLCTVFFCCCTVFCSGCIFFGAAVSSLLAALLDVRLLYRFVFASVSSILSAASSYLLIHRKTSELRFRQALCVQKQSTARTLQEKTTCSAQKHRIHEKRGVH